jgi:hypothetical protein
MRDVQSFLLVESGSQVWDYTRLIRAFSRSGKDHGFELMAEALGVSTPSSFNKTMN